MKKIRFAIAGLIFVSNFSNAEIIGREAREIAMADAAVFWAIASAASKSGRAACSNTPLACSDDRGELGLALLGEKNSSNSNQAFIGLLKYRLDASLSENYTCYALKKGRRLMHQLTSAEPAKLYSDCSAIVKNLSTTNREILGNTSRDSICSKESNMANTLKNLKTMISKNKKCQHQDF